MRAKILETYHYCSEKDKEIKEYYESHNYTDNEKQKAESLKKRLFEFIKIVRENDNIQNFEYYPESNIHYFEDIGYIALVNTDRDIVDVYFYGRTENEAFLNAIIDYELSYNINVEKNNRKKLNEDYSKRFLNNVTSDNDYHGPFFFAELSLKDFKKYYGENIPEDIINYYELHLLNIEREKFKYDYDSNSLVKIYKR